MSDSGTVDLAARKLRVTDLKSLEKADEYWTYLASDISFQVGLVWIQGKVTFVSEDKTKIVVLDEGVSARVINCDVVPGGSQWLQKNQYVMAVGLISSVSDEPIISAIKLADLSDNEVHERMWSAEVEELKRFLSS